MILGTDEKRRRRRRKRDLFGQEILTKPQKREERWGGEKKRKRSLGMRGEMIAEKSGQVVEEAGARVDMEAAASCHLSPFLLFPSPLLLPIFYTHSIKCAVI